MQIELKENQVIIWELEAPSVFRKFVEDFCRQVNAEEGKYILSDNEKELDISKNVEIILTPFLAAVNEKRCLNKVFAQLKELAFEEKYYLRTHQLFSELGNYFASLEQDMDINLSYEDEMDFSQLIKAVGVKIEEYESDMLGKLGQYLQVLARLLRKKLVVFVNLSTYLEQAEIEELLQQAFYLKLHIILIEQGEIALHVTHRRYIIDKDQCEIF